jgi:hypothetical protein
MGLFDLFKPKDKSRKLLLDMISYNADIIERDEGKPRSEAEYLAICLLIDDMQGRPKRSQGVPANNGHPAKRVPLPLLRHRHLRCLVYRRNSSKAGRGRGNESAARQVKTLALVIYWIGNAATFIKLTFFDGYVYNWWNWIIVLPLNEFLAAIWPLYWAIIRWIPLPH